MKRIISCILVLIAILTLLSGCAPQSVQVSDTRLLMDTYASITIHGDVDSQLLDDAFALVEELEGLFSITIEGSDVWRINNAGGEPVEVDERTIEVIKAGLEFAELSDGMFDITIGRLTQLWDFGAVDDDTQPLQSRVPNVEELEEALRTITQGYTNANTSEDVVPGITISTSNTIQLTNPDAWIDLGAIAKGFIADTVAEFLVEQGVSGAVINLGGDIVAVGNRQDGSPWQIALQSPFDDSSEWIGVVGASDVAVVASGIYERQFEEDGIIYHHILDPTTGMPVITDVVSAIIISENALIGEGLSTIAVLVGSERAPTLFDQVQGFIGAVIILDSGEVLTFGEVPLS